MGTRAKVMAALARTERSLNQLLANDEVIEDCRPLLMKHLAVITASLKDMRSSTVVADVQLNGFCEAFHLERLKTSNFETVGQVMYSCRNRVEEVLQDHLEIAAGILGLLLSEKRYIPKQR